MTLTMKYAEQITISGAAGAMGYVYYRANGMYDPDVNLGGHKPYGFDQYAAMYKNYVVHSGAISIKCCNNVTAVNSYIAVQSDSTFAVSPASIQGVIERPTVRWCVVTDQNPAHLYLRATTESELGCPRKLQLADDQLTGTTTADPARQWYWRIFGGPAITTDTWQTELLVTIYYNVTWFNHYEPGAS